MKQLTITYNGITVFDGEVEEFTCTDNDKGVKVEGRFTKTARGTASGPGLLEMLTTGLANASKAKTAEHADRLRESAETETDDTTATADAPEGDDE